MRPGRKGWLSAGNPGQFFKYRFPWRRSWVRFLLTDPQAKPMLARSGYVHVLLTTSSTLSGNSASRRLNVVFLVSVIIAIAAFFLLPSQNSGISSPSSNAFHANGSVNPTASCRQVLNNPKQVVADWILGQTSPVKVEAKEEILLGGVRSNILTLTCEDLSAEFRVSFVRVKDIWQLKNLVQLEN